MLFMLILGLLMAGGIYLASRNPNQSRISQGRRAFLGGQGGGNDEERAIFFGIQIAIQIFGSDELRARIARLIEAEDQTDTVQEKRRFLKSISALLSENKYAWEYGFWEYYTDAETSISSFNQWRNELEASMATEPEEMGSEVDRLRRTVTLEGRPLDLTGREYALLLCLAAQEGRVVARSELLQQVWATHFDPGSNLIDVQISRLRDKLGDFAWMIDTVRGKGYRLRRDPP